MTALPAGLSLGAVRGSWVWSHAAAAVPAGVLLDHGDHTLLVPWAECSAVPSGAVFTLDSLLPLTVVETVRCDVCGVTGLIRAGAWVSEGGDVSAQ